MSVVRSAAPEAAGPARAARASRLALLALFLGGVVLAFTGIFIKLSEIGPTATGFQRHLLSAPILWLWLRMERRRTEPAEAGGFRAPSGMADYLDLTLAATLFGLNTAAWCWCMKFTSVANGSLIANTSPIFVALGAWLLLGERFTRIFLAGLALSILGVAVLMSRSVSLGGELLLGDLLAVIASLLWGAYMLAVQRLRRRFTTATIMTWTAVVSAALLLVAALAAGESLIPRTLAGWEAILGLALVSHAGGQSLVAYALAQLPASFSSVGLLIQPVYATIAAWITLGETPGPLQAIGGAIVLAGIVVARRGSR